MYSAPLKHIEKPDDIAVKILTRIQCRISCRSLSRQMKHHIKVALRKKSFHCHLVCNIYLFKDKLPVFF